MEELGRIAVRVNRAIGGRKQHEEEGIAGVIQLRYRVTEISHEKKRLWAMYG